MPTPRLTCLFLPGLLLLPALRVVAQAENSDSAKLKGQIWTKTAQFVWQATKPGLNNPPPWGSTEQAARWLKQHDSANRSGMRDLPNQVLTALPKPDGVAQATPSLLVGTIVDMVRHDKKGLNSVSSTKLEAELRQLLPPTRPTASPTAALPVAAAQPDPITLTDTDASAAVSAAELADIEAPGQLRKLPSVQRGGSRHWLPTGLIALAAAAGGAVAGWLLGRGRRQHEISALKDKLQKKRGELAVMQQERDRSFRQSAANGTTPPLALPEREAAQEKAVPVGGPPLPAAVAEVTPTASLEASVAVLAAEVVAPAGPQVFFATLRENAFLEDGQLRTEASANHPLKITLDKPDANSARFEFNPGADQVALIEYRLELLREYFDFTLPAGRPSALLNRQPGTLTREAGGWRVNPTQKGTLDVR